MLSKISFHIRFKRNYAELFEHLHNGNVCHFRFSHIERGSYKNMLIRSLDFVTPFNYLLFFLNLSILVYNNTILSLRVMVYYLIITRVMFKKLVH